MENQVEEVKTEAKKPENLLTRLKITPKMIKVNQIGFTYNSQKYPKDTIVLEGPEVTMFLLKHQK